jgi:transcription antitermination factor NusG
MPILSFEPMIWPESLFDEGRDIPFGGQWWVLHVKPRSEKALARKCLKRQISYFLPQWQRQRRGQGRVKDSYLPLFPGYLFLFGAERDRLTALETNLVVNVLAVPNEQELFSDLQRIHRVIESGLSVLPAERLQPGMPVAIIDGPLAGLHGTVIRHKNKMTLTLKVTFLQQGAAVEMESWMVEPIVGPAQCLT